MTHSSADIPTPLANRYMTQLCKHWGHKFEVETSPGQGVIHLPLGDCAMTAGADALHVTLTPASAETDLARFETVVADHLQRFSFRDPLDIRWSRAAKPS